MAPKTVVPDIALEAFSCPHCGALADQAWHRVYADETNKTEAPHLWTPKAVANLKERLEDDLKPDLRKTMESWLPDVERQALGMPFLRVRDDSTYARYDLSNVYVSECFSCGDITIWCFDKILYPTTRHDVEPNQDMNEDIRADFDEARAVFATSPRASAALLRLCVQKLCMQLGKPGKKIDDDIKALVADGLPTKIQQALDLVRVIGNHAVHPGTINLNDDRETATKLFELVNLIAESQISQPKAIARLFDEKIPPGAKAAIARRDGNEP